MIPNVTVGTGISGVVRYALGEGKRDPVTGLVPQLQEGAEARVAWVSGQNFGLAIDSMTRVDTARRMMEWEAQNQGSPTRKCQQDALHLSLSWDRDERPSRKEMEEAAQMALKSLGMEKARAVFIAHNDTAHPHLHIVASRINPETGRAFDIYRSKTKLKAWAKDWELTHGDIKCAKRLNAAELAARWQAQPATLLEEVLRNRSTFTADDLKWTLSRAIAGDEVRTKIALDILARPEVIGLREQADAPVTRYTTRDILAAERALLKDAQTLAEARGKAAKPKALLGALDRHTRLSDEQRDAVRHLTGEGGLAVLAGEAGTGKSATLAAVREAYRDSGYQVIGMAWTNAVVQDMRRDGFTQSATLAAELKRVGRKPEGWNERTVLVVDEAAMLSTKHLAALTAQARARGAKLILVGDEQQLGSIERGGMFEQLRRARGAAELHEVYRVSGDQKRAFNLMHEGKFKPALEIFDRQGAVQWSATQDAARAALVAQYAKDSAIDPDKARFVFAYTNADVAALNQDIRAERLARGELTGGQLIDTADGQVEFAAGDRIQFTGNAYQRIARDQGLVNGNVGTIRKIDRLQTGQQRVTVALDGKAGEPLREISFPVGPNSQIGEFRNFRHGYAGTIYKGQGKTLDQSYLYHSKHWRSSSSYVALSRHREDTRIFVAKDTARDLDQLAQQMARVDERHAASHFHQVKNPALRADLVRGDAHVTKTAPSMIAAPVSRAGSIQMKQGLPSDDELLRQAEIEAERLRELQDQEERAQAFRRAKQIEFEEAQSKEADRQREAEAREGDISSAPARYAIALGENYSIRDPYGSLARAAMAEYAMFHRNQEKLRTAMAAERDPDKRRVIELRRTIEACDYMALTSQRLAGITVAIVGRDDAPQAVLDRERAADYRAQATALRTERLELIEAVEGRGQAAPGAATDNAQTSETAPANEVPASPASMSIDIPTEPEPAGTTTSQREEGPPVRTAQETEAGTTPAAESLAQIARDPDSGSAGGIPDKAGLPVSSFTINPTLSRSDVVTPSPTSYVTMAKDAPVGEPPKAEAFVSAERQHEMAWMGALRRRVEEASPPSGEVSDRTLSRLANRLQQQESSPSDTTKERALDGPGPEPDM